MSNLWCALWQSNNKLDGKREHLLRVGYIPIIFRTKKLCKQWIDGEYGYIKTRKDLRVEPHGWRLPKPVKVKVEQL